MPAYPALAILAAGAIPKQRSRIALAAVAGIFVVKALSPTAPRGLPFTPESRNPSEAALDAYASLHRANDLIVVEPDDQFYSSDLGLAHVRYLYLDSSPPKNVPLDFRHLGVTVTATQFTDLGELRPVFQERLRAFDLDSDAPVATVILARSKREAAALIESHPESDFYVPPDWTSQAHGRWQPSGTRAFLLSRKVIQRP
ncbi:MAG: hypothetical protein ACRD30_00430 [Bryobacteraceae bacterium]